MTKSSNVSYASNGKKHEISISAKWFDMTDEERTIFTDFIKEYLKKARANALHLNDDIKVLVVKDAEGRYMYDVDGFTEHRLNSKVFNEATVSRIAMFTADLAAAADIYAEADNTMRYMALSYANEGMKFADDEGAEDMFASDMAAHGYDDYDDVMKFYNAEKISLWNAEALSDLGGTPDFEEEWDMINEKIEEIRDEYQAMADEHAEKIVEIFDRHGMPGNYWFYLKQEESEEWLERNREILGHLLAVRELAEDCMTSILGNTGVYVVPDDGVGVSICEVPFGLEAWDYDGLDKIIEEYRAGIAKQALWDAAESGAEMYWRGRESAEEEYKDGLMSEEQYEFYMIDSEVDAGNWIWEAAKECLLDSYSGNLSDKEIENIMFGYGNTSEAEERFADLVVETSGGQYVDWKVVGPEIQFMRAE